MSIPLAPQGATVGAVNIYRFDQTDAFSGDLRQGYEIFAAQASGALHLATLQTRQTELRKQLEQALTSRSVIDQAIGILVAEQRCNAEAAFGLLRLRSQSSQQKLRDVAAVIGHFGVDADTAFDMLRRWSSHTKLKLREISGYLVAAASRPGPDRSSQTALEDASQYLNQLSSHPGHC